MSRNLRDVIVPNSESIGQGIYGLRYRNSPAAALTRFYGKAAYIEQ